VPQPYTNQTRDLTKQYLGFDRAGDTYRPGQGLTYLPGMLVTLAPLDRQYYPDQSTVEPSYTTATPPQMLIGVVAEIWPGFNGSLNTPPNYVSNTNQQTSRGTQGVDCITNGYHPALLIDQSGTGAVAITNGSPIIASRATVGYGQGATSTSAPGGATVVACAMLPSTLTLTAATLAQASQTDTLTGTPATGDTLSVTIQTPYSAAQPGTIQTTTFTVTLTAAQATSVTTAAAALVAYLNSQTLFSTYFIASNTAGVVTIAVNTLSSPFTYTLGSGTYVASQYSLGLSGVVGNGLTFSVASTGGTISTAGGASLAGGTGFKGPIPAYVVCN
jgi:hypothetical protein